jgi:DNA-binding MarR family transcriptional regulator
MKMPAEGPRLASLLRLSSKKVHDKFLVRLHEEGFLDITQSTFPLFYFPTVRGNRPTELTEKMGISKQALNNVLVSMEAARYIERRKEAGGRGRRLVWLTERGEELSELLSKIAIEIEEEVARQIGPDEFDRLHRLLLFVAEEL